VGARRLCLASRSHLGVPEPRYLVAAVIRLRKLKHRLRPPSVASVIGSPPSRLAFSTALVDQVTPVAGVAGHATSSGIPLPEVAKARMSTARTVASSFKSCQIGLAR
jgi:hypothetical protein